MPPTKRTDPSDDPQPTDSTASTTGAARPRRRAASRPAGPPEGDATATAGADAAGDQPAPRKRTRAKKTAAAEPTDAPDAGAEAKPSRTRKRTTKKAAAEEAAGAAGTPPAPLVVTFQPPELTAAPRPRKKAAAKQAPADVPAETPAPSEPAAAEDEGEAGAPSGTRRRRGRRGRGGGGGGGGAAAAEAVASDAPSADDAEPAAKADRAGEPDDGADGVDGAPGTGTHRRRRRRRRGGSGTGDADLAPDDPPNTVVRVREPRQRQHDDDAVRGFSGSTRLEARKQRRREGREAGRRPTILTESEFLARRESVERIMVVRQTADRTQVAVLEDGVLVEHFVTHAEAGSMVGNVYLGRVQNVLPSMEAAFVDIGKGRNAVLYAGEVNWDASNLEGQPRRIELALKSGQPVLVQVSKDPIGHKGARLTSQISIPGRYVAYVPEGRTAGISRKLPDTERTRLKSVLKDVVPEGAGVVVRTAAEGASEEELGRDIRRLQAQWENITKQVDTANAPALLYSEPDLVIRVIRDVFNEDFTELVVSGNDEWDTVEQYVGHVAPDLSPKLRKWTDEQDIFASYRIDEQLVKALDRKVWLPSGGYLVIDRTEAMVVVDVNTGKFTGKGGNLEETVTKNNLEAAEEVVRQLRLRDLGGIIVIDFVDMVLESNRELVLRRLVECLGRDRTRHQVAEITSLGLVQMTRKRVGQGLLEAFSETCPECNGRGVKVHLDGAPARSGRDGGRPGGRSNDRSDGRGDGGGKGKGGKKARDKAADKTGDKAADKATDKATDEATDNAAESAEPVAEPVAAAAD
jgi:ribonuclease E